MRKALHWASRVRHLARYCNKKYVHPRDWGEEENVLSSDITTRYGKENDGDFSRREKDSQTIKSLDSKRDRV